MNKKILFILYAFCHLVYAQNKEVSSDWTSFTQSISITSKNTKKFKLTGSIKVISKDSLAWAGLWARVDNKNGETGFFDNMWGRKIQSSKWKNYNIEGEINSNSQTLFFGGLCMNNGDFYFDDIHLYIEDTKGDYKEVAINNPGFEKSIHLKKMDGWHEGTSNKTTHVKEFEISSNKDAKKGKLCLLIKGRKIKARSFHLKAEKDVSPQIGTLIFMLNDLSTRVERAVKNLSQYEIDHLHDEKANRIGALVMHLAAAEAYYQVYTFENREFNDDEKKKWKVALDLDQKGRDQLKGKPISHYLNAYKEVRKKTIEELKKRDDLWLSKSIPGSPMNNHYSWFHVMEHQSSHLGQILFLKKRIPEEPKIINKGNIKD